MRYRLRELSPAADVSTTRRPFGAGVAQLAERQPSKLDVAGSNPVSRSNPSLFRLFRRVPRTPKPQTFALPGVPVRGFSLTVATSALVLGCGLLPGPTHDSSPSGAMAHVGQDLGDVHFTGPNDTCVPLHWVTGVIVPGRSGEATIREDDGDVRQLTWGSHNPAAVDWNRRYTIGGIWFNTSDNLWACGGADSVIPQ